MRLPFGAKALGLMVMAMLAALLTCSFQGSWRTLYLPGRTSDGHYQIETNCKTCHGESFTDAAALQKACLRCHGTELVAANDSHPEKKFRDPRNWQRVQQLDARYCVTCHREHRPEQTTAMGLTVPSDYCYRCHSEIGTERPSHKGLAFSTCADTGCHNFHDNRGLYEDFLLKHRGEPRLLASPRSPARLERSTAVALQLSDADAPPTVTLGADEKRAWAGSAHARGAVNCSGCHAASGKAAWRDHVGDEVCGDCHRSERDGFRAGRHGMRQASGLSALRVGEARQPMRPEAANAQLSCTSCHGPHSFDTRRAAVDACLGCHADTHSRSYRGSTHEQAWLADSTGRSGASCATCHLPRAHTEGEGVVHNQNDNLRPSDKMLRSVCLDCHGLEFAIDALADTALVERNFRGSPRRHVDSLQMAERRLEH